MPTASSACDRVVPHLGGGVLRGHGEIAAFVDRLRALVVLEDEVLELRPDVERVEAHALHPFERLTESKSRIALVRRAVGRDDVADHPRDVRADRVAMVIDRTRHELEARRVGNRNHVRLLDRVETRDRRTVEAHPVVQRLRHLRRCDRERLEVSLEVGEPEENVLDAFILDPLEHRPPRSNARRRAVLALHHRALRRPLRRLRPWSCHGTSLEMEKAPDGRAARGHVASHRSQDSSRPRGHIPSMGFFATKTTKSSSAVGCRSAYPARSSMSAKPAASSMSTISWVK